MQENLADIILCENICRNFLKELDNGNDKNTSNVIYFLNNIDERTAYSCFKLYFQVLDILNYNLDKNNDFFNFVMKIKNIHYKNEDDFNNFHIFYLKRKLINNPHLTEVTHHRLKTKKYYTNRNIIVTRLQNNEFKVVIEE